MHTKNEAYYWSLSRSKITAFNSTATTQHSITKPRATTPKKVSLSYVERNMKSFIQELVIFNYYGLADFWLQVL